MNENSRYYFNLKLKFSFYEILLKCDKLDIIQSIEIEITIITLLIIYLLLCYSFILNVIGNVTMALKYNIILTVYE